MIFYNEGLQPLKIKINVKYEQTLDQDFILGVINYRYTLVNPIWYRHSEYAIVKNMRFFGLVYMTAEELSEEEKETDWRYKLMIEVIEELKEQNSLPRLIPFITHFDYVANDEEMIFP